MIPLINEARFTLIDNLTYLQKFFVNVTDDKI